MKDVAPHSDGKRVSKRVEKTLEVRRKHLTQGEELSIIKPEPRRTNLKILEGGDAPPTLSKINEIQNTNRRE